MTFRIKALFLLTLALLLSPDGYQSLFYCAYKPLRISPETIMTNFRRLPGEPMILIHQESSDGGIEAHSNRSLECHA